MVDKQSTAFTDERGNTSRDVSCVGASMVAASPAPSTVRNPDIRRNEDGSLDEIVAAGATVHLEKMDDDEWWLRIDVGERHIQVNFGSTAPIRATVEEWP
jgi:hypothetical protein